MLQGIKVLDLGRYVAGPYAATLLGYMGAEVIRIERPGGGEDRFIAPIRPSDNGSGGEGAVFFQTACNKQSMTLDFSKPDGQAVLHRLVKTADVIVVNLPVPALKKYNIDYQTLSALNERLIYCSTTSFGSKGPDALKGGFDGVGQAASGAMYMTGQPGQPVKSAAPYVDYSTAVLSATGILAALYAREKSGKGELVETSLLGTALSVFNSHLIEEGTLQLGRVPSSNRVQTSGPSDVFKCTDGFVLIHVVGPGLFRRVTKLLDQPQWLDDPRFASDQLRGDHRDELCEYMQSWFNEKSVDEAISLLSAAGIPCGKVNSLAETLKDPQVSAMGFLKDVSMPGMQRPAPVSDLPVRFSNYEAGIARPPSELGSDNKSILEKLGFSDDEISSLLARGIM